MSHDTRVQAWSKTSSAESTFSLPPLTGTVVPAQAKKKQKKKGVKAEAKQGGMPSAKVMMARLLENVGRKSVGGEDWQANKSASTPKKTS